MLFEVKYFFPGYISSQCMLFVIVRIDCGTIEGALSNWNVLNFSMRAIAEEKRACQAVICEPYLCITILNEMKKYIVSAPFGSLSHLYKENYYISIISGVVCIQWVDVLH